MCDAPVSVRPGVGWVDGRDLDDVMGGLWHARAERATTIMVLVFAGCDSGACRGRMA